MGLPPHPPQHWSRPVTTRTQSAEEYLEAIFKLQRGAEPVTVKRLAGELGVAPPSVSEMLGRLRAAGLVEEPAEGRGIALTEEGNVEGATLVRRHRLSERFLVDYLDMPWDAVHEEACKLEHVLSPEVEARLADSSATRSPARTATSSPPKTVLSPRRTCARCRGLSPARTPSSAASPRRRATCCATSRRSACFPTRRSPWRASRRSTARCSSASAAPSTPSGER